MLQKMERQRQLADLRQHWLADRSRFECKVMGFAVCGSLQILGDRLVLSSTLPFLATPFKGQIEQTIRRQAEAALS
jgi:hypothetical protein